jgi:hypothetical protein
MIDVELKLKKFEEFNHQLRMNWAEDHSYIQRVCQKHGFSELEVEGDQWGVPDIQNLADLLDKKIEELNGRLERIAR